MAKISICPDLPELEKFATGHLTPTELELVMEHLAKCEECLAKLPTISAKDTLVDVLAKAKTLAGEAEDPAVTRLVARLAQLRQTPRPYEAAKSMKFSCTNCGKSLKVNTELVGKKVKCPGCAKTVLVPAGVENFGPGGADKPGLDVSVEKTVPPDLQASKTAAKLAEERTVPSQGPDTKTGLSGVGQFTQMAPVPTDGGTEALDFLAPPQQPDELGRLERYRILKKLGAGGMGMVFLGEDTLLSRKVAIKVMLPQFAASSAARERFLREARSAASIEHEHIVPIFQVGEDNTVPFLAIPFLKGEPLDACLEREGKLPLPEALRIAKEMAEGLAAAHANNLIHRDIKPGNVWLEGKKAKVRLLDFGLARAQDDTTHLTQTGALVGTPAYMAPEQARGDKLDGRADLFSLGCVLYLMLTGQRPFKGNDTISLLMSLAVETPTLPTLMNPDVPDAVSDLTMRLLAKDAADRPASAQVVADELTALIDGEPSPVSGRVKTQSAAPPRRRSPIMLGIGAVAVLLLVGGLGGAFWLYQIVIIRDRDGNKIAEINVPKDGKVEIVPDGKKIDAKPVEAAIPLDPAWLKQIAFLPAEEQQKAVADKLNLPVEATNKLGMKLRLIPPGDDVAKAFYLGKYEVTQGEWEKVMGYNPSYFSAKGNGGSKVAGMDTSKFPVDTANWFDSVQYCNKLSEREGLKPYYELTVTKWTGKGRKQIEEAEVKILGGSGYHIPTDAEWEHGCRAGTKTKYHCGDNDEDLQEYAWFDKNSEGRTHAVGEKKPNAFGLYDMHGNAVEWNEEMLTNAKGAPERVYRGGAWHNPAGYCTVRARNRTIPALLNNQSHGLRVARVADDSVSAAIPPLDPAWLDNVAKLPAREQVEAVKAELMKRNPGTDEKIATFSIEAGVVREMEFRTLNVTDISPLRALSGLRRLKCRGNANGRSQLADLSPLEGTKLTFLMISFTQVTDLTPIKDLKLTLLHCQGVKLRDLSILKDMPLTELHCGNTGVTDLTALRGMKLTNLDFVACGVSDLMPLEGMQLTYLGCHFSKVKDLSPLTGMPLAVLKMEGAPVADIAPLKGMPLKTLDISFRMKRDAEILRSITTLQVINGQPRAAFWKEVDPMKDGK